MSTLTETPEEKGLCLLSFGKLSSFANLTHILNALIDAGGTRAISQLRILAHVTNQLDLGSSNWRNKPPYLVFDMIGGTGTQATGSFIALLLVLLGLNTEQILSEFVDLSDNILDKQGLTSQARTKELVLHIDDLLKRYHVRPNARLLDQNLGSGSCKVVVPISYKHDAGSMCTLRNFQVRQEQTLNLTIREALLVTLAAPPLFTPIAISKDSVTFEYIGGDMTLSNPVQEIISEACSAFDMERRVACLVSLGCGHPGVISAPDNTNLEIWNRFLENLAAGNERTAQAIDRQMGHLGIYFRFCVATGLEKALQRSQPTTEEILAHTNTYLEDGAVSQKVDTCVDFLTVRGGLSSLEQLSEFASQFFIDSSSKARLRADIVRNVRALGTEHSQKTFEDCLLFLAEASPEGPRLIMYDNVDDPDLELASLLPRGKACVILITSRDRLMGGLCPEGH
ncbi:hypothetical protein M408DRAFT_80521, partial [Serendipita vermifera MAFF 305830]